MTLAEALGSLDPANDDHWTTNGLPRADVISTMVGQQITRKQITDASPALTRESGSAAADTSNGLVMDFADTLRTGGVDETRAMLRSLEVRVNDLQQQKRAIDRELDDVGRRMEMLNRKLARIEPSAGEAFRDQVKRAQAVAFEERLRRAGAAQAFVNAGTTAADVRAALNPTSPLDSAMARKTGRGRPNFGAQVG